MIIVLALAVAATVTFAAAFFIHYRGFAALRAQVADNSRWLERQLLRPGGEFRFWRFIRGWLVGRLVQIFLPHLSHTIPQTAHLRCAKSCRAPAADVLQLVDKLLEPFARLVA